MVAILEERRKMVVLAEERIGDRLRRLRTEAGLSQRELAKRSGVDREYICQIEANKTKGMTLRIAEALAKGMGIAPCCFFDEDHKELTRCLLEKVIAQIKTLDEPC
jgi:repressor LexA